MSIFKRSIARVVLIACVVGGVLMVPGSAGAASTQGKLGIKGAGTLYTGSNHYVSVAAAGGVYGTFSVLVTNTGDSSAQYNLKLSDPGHTAVQLFVGTNGTDNGVQAESPDGFFTPTIAAHKSQVFTLKIAGGSGYGQQSYYFVMRLYSTAGTLVDTVNPILEIAAPTKGTSSSDLFVRNGSQAFVGGPLNSQIATSPSLAPKAGSSAAFTVRLQNDSASPTPIGLYGLGAACADSFVLTVKDGSLDVTSAVMAGTYATKPLAKGAHKDLTATVKWTGLNPTCGEAIYTLYSLHGQSGPTGNFEGILVNLAS